MAEVKWIKIATDIFDDEKMLLIDALPERDGLIVIWFKLLCMAGKQNNGGVFMFNDKLAYTDEMLATIFRRPLNTVRLALQTFESFGMIEIVNDTVTIPKWEKHQSLDKIEQAKEKNRKRVAAFRERQKQIACNDYSNDYVTESNAVDKDIDKDIDIEKERKKERKKSDAGSYEAILAEYTSNQELQQALLEFVKMRKLIKKPLTDRALRLILSKLDTLANDDGAKINILNQSIVNNWQGVFPLKDYSGGNQRQQQPTQARPETEADRIRREQAEQFSAMLAQAGGDQK